MRLKQRERELMGDTSCRDISWSQAVGMAMNRPGLGVMLMIAVTAALVLAGMWNLSTALLLVAALLVAIGLQFLSPRFWRRLRAIRANPAPVLPEALEFRDPGVVELIARLRRARHARDRAIAQSPHERWQVLGPCHASLAELERQAIVVAARAEYARTSLDELPEGGWSSHGEGREAVRRLEASAAALMARLEHLAVVLEAVPAKLANVELLRLEESDRLIGSDTTEAEKELAQLDAPAD
jgi:hypothetical protein